MKEIKLELRNTNNLSLNLRNNKALSLGTTSVPTMNVVEAKIDTTANWNNKTSYIPRRGVVIVYSDKWKDLQGNDVPGVKIGDGQAYVVDLPFVGSDTAEELVELLNGHINNTVIHITAEEREFWNNKLNYTIDGETLEFNRE